MDVLISGVLTDGEVEDPQVQCNRAQAQDWRPPVSYLLFRTRQW